MSSIKKKKSIFKKMAKMAKKMAKMAKMAKKWQKKENDRKSKFIKMC
jgi:hypothetical protein